MKVMLIFIILGMFFAGLAESREKELYREDAKDERGFKSRNIVTEEDCILRQKLTISGPYKINQLRSVPMRNLACFRGEQGGGYRIICKHPEEIGIVEDLIRKRKNTWQEVSIGWGSNDRFILTDAEATRIMNTLNSLIDRCIVSNDKLDGIDQAEKSPVQQPPVSRNTPTGQSNTSNGRGGVVRLEKLYTGGYSFSCADGFRDIIFDDKNYRAGVIQYCLSGGNCSTNPSEVANEACR